MDERKPAILVVEDSVSFQELYQEILGPEYDLVILGSKDQAVSILEKRTFDVALIDMRLQEKMGNVDGLELAEYIRVARLSMEIIVKSGYPTQTPEIESRLRKLDPVAVLDKHADGQVATLLDAVNRAVARHREYKERL